MENNFSLKYNNTNRSITMRSERDHYYEERRNHRDRDRQSSTMREIFGDDSDNNDVHRKPVPPSYDPPPLRHWQNEPMLQPTLTLSPARRKRGRKKPINNLKFEELKRKRNYFLAHKWVEKDKRKRNSQLRSNGGDVKATISQLLNEPQVMLENNVDLRDCRVEEELRSEDASLRKNYFTEREDCQRRSRNCSPPRREYSNQYYGHGSRGRGGYSYYNSYRGRTNPRYINNRYEDNSINDSHYSRRGEQMQSSNGYNPQFSSMSSPSEKFSKYPKKFKNIQKHFNTVNTGKPRTPSPPIISCPISVERSTSVPNDNPSCLPPIHPLKAVSPSLTSVDSISSKNLDIFCDSGNRSNSNAKQVATSETENTVATPALLRNSDTGNSSSANKDSVETSSSAPNNECETLCPTEDTSKSIHSALNTESKAISATAKTSSESKTISVSSTECMTVSSSAKDPSKSISSTSSTESKTVPSLAKDPSKSISSTSSTESKTVCSSAKDPSKSISSTSSTESKTVVPSSAKDPSKSISSIESKSVSSLAKDTSKSSISSTESKMVPSSDKNSSKSISFTLSTESKTPKESSKTISPSFRSVISAIESNSVPIANRIERIITTGPIYNEDFFLRTINPTKSYLPQNYIIPKKSKTATILETKSTDEICEEKNPAVPVEDKQKNNNIGSDKTVKKMPAAARNYRSKSLFEPSNIMYYSGREGSDCRVVDMDIEESAAPAPRQSTAISSVSSKPSTSADDNKFHDEDAELDREVTELNSRGTTASGAANKISLVAYKERFASGASKSTRPAIRSRSKSVFTASSYDYVEASNDFFNKRVTRSKSPYVPLLDPDANPFKYLIRSPTRPETPEVVRAFNKQEDEEESKKATAPKAASDVVHKRKRGRPKKNRGCVIADPVPAKQIKLTNDPRTLLSVLESAELAASSCPAKPKTEFTKRYTNAEPPTEPLVDAILREMDRDILSKNVSKIPPNRSPREDPTKCTKLIPITTTATYSTKCNIQIAKERVDPRIFGNNSVTEFHQPLQKKETVINVAAKKVVNFSLNGPNVETKHNEKKHSYSQLKKHISDKNDRDGSKESRMEIVASEEKKRKHDIECSVENACKKGKDEQKAKDTTEKEKVEKLSAVRDKAIFQYNAEKVNTETSNKKSETSKASTSKAYDVIKIDYEKSTKKNVDLSVGDYKKDTAKCNKKSDSADKVSEVNKKDFEKVKTNSAKAGISEQQIKNREKKVTEYDPSKRPSYVESKSAKAPKERRISDTQSSKKDKSRTTSEAVTTSQSTETAHPKDIPWDHKLRILAEPCLEKETNKATNNMPSLIEKTLEAMESSSAASNTAALKNEGASSTDKEQTQLLHLLAAKDIIGSNCLMTTDYENAMSEVDAFFPTPELKKEDLLVHSEKGTSCIKVPETCSVSTEIIDLTTSEDDVSDTTTNKSNMDEQPLTKDKLIAIPKTDIVLTLLPKKSPAADSDLSTSHTDLKQQSVQDPLGNNSNVTTVSDIPLSDVNPTSKTLTSAGTYNTSAVPNNNVNQPEQRQQVPSSCNSNATVAVNKPRPVATPTSRTLPSAGAHGASAVPSNIINRLGKQQKVPFRFNSNATVAVNIPRPVATPLSKTSLSTGAHGASAVPNNNINLLEHQQVQVPVRFNSNATVAVNNTRPVATPTSRTLPSAGTLGASAVSNNNQLEHLYTHYPFGNNPMVNVAVSKDVTPTTRTLAPVAANLATPITNYLYANSQLQPCLIYTDANSNLPTATKRTNAPGFSSPPVVQNLPGNQHVVSNATASYQTPIQPHPVSSLDAQQARQNADTSKETRPVSLLQDQISGGISVKQPNVINMQLNTARRTNQLPPINSAVQNQFIAPNIVQNSNRLANVPHYQLTPPPAPQNTLSQESCIVFLGEIIFCEFLDYFFTREALKYSAIFMNDHSAILKQQQSERQSYLKQRKLARTSSFKHFFEEKTLSGVFDPQIVLNSTLAVVNRKFSEKKFEWRVDMKQLEGTIVKVIGNLSDSVTWRLIISFVYCKEKLLNVQNKIIKRNIGTDVIFDLIDVQAKVESWGYSTSKMQFLLHVNKLKTKLNSLLAPFVEHTYLVLHKQINAYKEFVSNPCYTYGVQLLQMRQEVQQRRGGNNYLAQQIAQAAAVAAASEVTTPGNSRSPVTLSECCAAPANNSRPPSVHSCALTDEDNRQTPDITQNQVTAVKQEKNADTELPDLVEICHPKKEMLYIDTKLIMEINDSDDENDHVQLMGSWTKHEPIGELKPKEEQQEQLEIPEQQPVEENQPRISSRDSGYFSPIGGSQSDIQFCFCDSLSRQYVCSGCMLVVYCSKECQQRDWPSHAANCAAGTGGEPRNYNG